MERGSWSEVAGDSEVWKKLAIGGACFVTILPLPIALGAVLTDLETELKSIKEDKASGEFIGFEGPAGLLGRGLAPTFIFVLTLMLFCFPSVVVCLSALQAYGWTDSEFGVNILSALVTSVFGLLALAVQFLFGAIFPIALAQYARGVHIKTALDPMAAVGSFYEMGAPFWWKTTGYWLFLLASMVLTLMGINFWIDLVLRLGLASLGFASLIVASRYALGQLQTKL
jgi:hypothetical protein